MLKSVPQQIQDQLNSVYEFAKIMEKQNGEKPRPEQEKEGKQEQQGTETDREKVPID